MMDKAKLVIEIAQKLLNVADDLRRLADSVQAVCGIISEGLSEEPHKEYTALPEISMEKVRGLLAEKSRAGHTAEVKAILKKYGADRLSDVDPADYAAIIKEAEELEDE